DRGALPLLVEIFNHSSESFGGSLQNRRSAAEALGRIGDKSAVPTLLDALGDPKTASPDTPAGRVLQHSLTYALIEIGDRESTAAGLQTANPLTLRAALIALDRMHEGHLDVAIVAKELASPDARVK